MTLIIIQNIVKRSIVYAECDIQALHAECHYAECHYAECRGAFLNESVLPQVQLSLGQKMTKIDFLGDRNLIFYLRKLCQ